MADYTFARSYKLTNAIKVEELPKDHVWNTGLNCVRGQEAVVEDKSELLPKINHNQISVPIYGNKNQYIVLNPGDSVTVTVETDEAAQFYLSQYIEGVLTVDPNSEGEETGMSVDNAESL